MSGAMDVVLNTVALSEETIDQLTSNSAYGARILETFRERLVDKYGHLTRVKLEDVLATLDAEIEAFHHGATREAWTKPKDGS